MTSMVFLWNWLFSKKCLIWYHQLKFWAEKMIIKQTIFGIHFHNFPFCSLSFLHHDYWIGALLVKDKYGFKGSHLSVVWKCLSYIHTCTWGSRKDGQLWAEVKTFKEEEGAYVCWVIEWFGFRIYPNSRPLYLGEQGHEGTNFLFSSNFGLQLCFWWNKRGHKQTQISPFPFLLSFHSWEVCHFIDYFISLNTSRKLIYLYEK